MADTEDFEEYLRKLDEGSTEIPIPEGADTVDDSKISLDVSLEAELEKPTESNVVEGTSSAEPENPSAKTIEEELGIPDLETFNNEVLGKTPIQTPQDASNQPTELSETTEQSSSQPTAGGRSSEEVTVLAFDAEGASEDTPNSNNPNDVRLQLAEAIESNHKMQTQLETILSSVLGDILARSSHIVDLPTSGDLTQEEIERYGAVSKSLQKKFKLLELTMGAILKASDKTAVENKALMERIAQALKKASESDAELHRTQDSMRALQRERLEERTKMQDEIARLKDRNSQLETFFENIQERRRQRLMAQQGQAGAPSGGSASRGPAAPPVQQKEDIFDKIPSAFDWLWKS